MKLQRPWVSIPATDKLGATRGSWWKSMVVIALAVAFVVVVLVLVETDHLSRGWAYACLPIAIVAAAASRVLTIFKAAAEDKDHTQP
jgi:heme/copper-type cytochrome/quinol oxidase subunit 4